MSKPQTIREAIAEYKATPPGAKSLISRLFDALCNIRCPHCGEGVSVVLTDEGSEVFHQKKP